MSYSFFIRKNMLQDDAVIFRHDMVTYRAFDEKTSHLSNVLKKINLNDQSTLGILVGNSPLFICAFLAVVKLGATAVLFSTNFKKREFEDYVKDTGVEFIITDEKSAAIAEDLSFDHEMLHHEPDFFYGDLRVLKVISSNDRVALGLSQKNDDKILTLQFTSGVNGKSKIVPRTYRNITDEILNFSQTISLSHTDTILCPAPLFHTYALINGFLAAFHNGAKLILMEKFVPNDFISLVKKYRPTIFVGVPFMYSLLTQTFLTDRADFSSLRLCFSAGAKMPKEMAEKIHARFGVRVNQQYGSTETGVMAVNLYEDGFTDVDSVGRAVQGRTIKIVDEANNEMPPGKEGEIKVKGLGTTSGYLSRAVVSEKVFNESWYFTGDIGWMDPSGNLYITGRKSSFINVAGLKVDPFEIERVLLSSSYVKECVVVGMPDKNCGEIIKAYVVPENDVTVKIINDFCKDRLADYKVPRIVEFLDALPKSPTGKILKKYLNG